MKSKIVLTGAIAGAMAMGAMGMIAPSAHALDLGLGGGSHTSARVDNSGPGSINSGSGISSRNRVGVGINDNNDANGGIMARSRTNVSANDDFDRDRARIQDESDSRFHSGVSSRVNSDTSAGADENADLRAEMRHGDNDNNEGRGNADARVGTNVSADTGLLGLSVGSRTRAGGGISFND